MVERLRTENRRKLGEQIKGSKRVGHSIKAAQLVADGENYRKHITPKHVNHATPYVLKGFEIPDFTSAEIRAMSTWYGEDKWVEKWPNLPTKLGQDTNAIPLSRRHQNIRRRIVDTIRQIHAANITSVRNWTDPSIPETNWGLYAQAPYARWSCWVPGRVPNKPNQTMR